jgi:hypothetical protein
MQGGMAEPPRVSIAAAEIVSLPGALSALACAALRKAVDDNFELSHYTTATAGADSNAARRRAAIADHLRSRPFSSQLNLPRDSLATLIGGNAVPVDSLWALAASVPGQSADDYGEDADVEVLVRRYTPDDRPWIPFHNDRVSTTVNVALCDDRSFGGGVLLGVYNGALHRMPREEGMGTAHPSTLLHGVTRITWGLRYSLILFSPRVHVCFAELKSRECSDVTHTHS